MAASELPQRLLDALDQWRSEQAPPIDRDDAVRQILEDWLIGHGYLPHDPDEGAKPEDLNSSNDG